MPIGLAVTQCVALGKPGARFCHLSSGTAAIAPWGKVRVLRVHLRVLHLYFPSNFVIVTANSKIWFSASSMSLFSHFESWSLPSLPSVIAPESLFIRCISILCVRTSLCSTARTIRLTFWPAAIRNSLHFTPAHISYDRYIPLGLENLPTPSYNSRSNYRGYDSKPGRQHAYIQHRHR